jgi:peroxiredoxin
MLQLLFSAALAPLVVSAHASLPAGTQLNLRGTVAAVASEAPTGEKEFDLTLWAMATTDGSTEVLWLVDERGHGAFPWPARFGNATLDGNYRSSAPGPALLYDRGEGQSVVPVLWPFLTAAESLAEGVDFRDETLEYHVDRPTKRSERNVWRISARDSFGPKRTLFVDQQSPLLLEVEEKLTMGRGEAYQLKLQFVGSEQLSEDRIAAISKAANAASAVRNKLNLPPRKQELEFTAVQAETLKKELPQLLEVGAGTPLENLVKTAQRDLELQAGRNDAVATMQGRFVGQPVEDFQIHSTTGETLSRNGLKGKVTVLHFWDYRDEPLREPYGQIGYLDFLYHRRKSAGLQVYGVAVNSRLADETTRGAAERSVKKLKSFMNLSYPVLLDGGGLLRQFGDPRVIGASLPLFVVVGPEGTIVHYHVGTYEVQQDQGLKELDDVVAGLLGKKS